jgi:hypothetical protein
MHSCLFFIFLGRAALQCFGGGWYVGNTAPGERIQYTNVWLSGGSYRFTANAGSPSAGAAMHMVVDGVSIGSSVAVPDTGRVDAFSPINLGYRTLSQGYHSLQVDFDTSGVSLDWFMLVKDTDTTTNVKASDITMVRPPAGGMLISPIIGYEHMTTPNSIFSANDAASLISEPETSTNGARYSDYQLRSWPSAYLGWELQVQTNAPGVGLGTNWVTEPDSDATNQMTFQIDPAQGTIFFRLVSP